MSHVGHMSIGHTGARIPTNRPPALNGRPQQGPQRAARVNPLPSSMLPLQMLPRGQQWEKTWRRGEMFLFEPLLKAMLPSRQNHWDSDQGPTSELDTRWRGGGCRHLRCTHGRWLYRAARVQDANIILRQAWHKGWELRLASCFLGQALGSNPPLVSL